MKNESALEELSKESTADMEPSCETMSKDDTKTESPSLPQQTSRKFRKSSKFSSFLSSNQGHKSTFDSIVNEYEQAESCIGLVKNSTGIVFDENTSFHKCVWDEKYIENPDRFSAIIERCTEAGVLDRCERLSYQLPTKNDILRIHDQKLYDQLQNISKSQENQWEVDAACYDSVYFNESTFDAAMISAGCAISIVDAVCNNRVQNGMAIIRPPGHHAMENEFCGFCYFNNVAIATKYALEMKLANKILIVDIDVHHGQATQQAFYNSNNVLYFSIHRYEHGRFWPNLRESNFDYIGEENGLGYNINFPLNAIGLTDSDYLTIVFQILLPVAYEFNPDLIIVSAGYDACLGCPEFNPDLIIVSAGYDAAIGDSKGEMVVTPAFYGHLITLLSGLAKGKIAVCLEGGYFLPSLAEGVTMTIKALLGDACGHVDTVEKPHDVIIDTINDLRIVLRKYWRCFHLYGACPSLTASQQLHKIDVKYLGVPLMPPYQTRQCYPVISNIQHEFYNEAVHQHRQKNEVIGINQTVGCSYHEDMLLHKPHVCDRHVETPLRLLATYNTYKEWNLHTRCLNITPQPFDVNLLREVHQESFIDSVLSQNFEFLTIGKDHDMYYNNDTLTAITKANECLLAVVDAVLNGTCRSGVAMIRPPGHHAEDNNAMGFCFINNVAVAAKYISTKLDRVVIIDFDIHHGNGTQKIFYENNKVLYISIHKYFPNCFFPNTTDGNYNYSGKGEGAGYNVNVALKALNMHDIDYMTIFFSIVLPIVYSFNPDIVLVSAGFDAGINDPLGQYKLSPECFGHFIQLLKPLANGRIILALEGGYNTTTVKYSMNICIKTLLGDPLPKLNCKRAIHSQLMKAIANVKSIHKTYWPILDVDKKLVLPKHIKRINTKPITVSSDCQGG